MNADMINRGTEDPPPTPPTALSLIFFLGGGGHERPLRPPCGSATDNISLQFSSCGSSIQIIQVFGNQIPFSYSFLFYGKINLDIHRTIYISRISIEYMCYGYRFCFYFYDFSLGFWKLTFVFYSANCAKLSCI